jgi:preprotein translocase SecF subunit
MINFNKFYKLFNLVSLSLVIISFLLLFFKGLNFGVDFKGGTLIELRANNETVNISSLRESFNKMNLGDVSINKFGNDKDFLVKIEKKNPSKDAIRIIKKSLTENIGASFTFRRVENVGPKVSSELLKSGMIAIALSLAAMLFYIWIRFEWQFSLAAIAAIIHDVIITIGIFSFLSYELNL